MSYNIHLTKHKTAYEQHLAVTKHTSLDANTDKPKGATVVVETQAIKKESQTTVGRDM